ncbi:MAG TPA: YhjD/YihY/BrkB family envelope integrity protein, partial [Actinospica sp.]|nr:YhjD/YihY/BrkB family envelope integrity protein [Actinospica sp.]
MLVERYRGVSERIERTRVYRSYHRYGVQRGARLAAAMTYSAFLSIFPALVLALAIATVFLGDSGVERVNGYIAHQLPGLGEKFSLNGVVANATTVGLISGVILLWSALSWVNTARGSMRMIWGVDDMPGN